MSVSICARGGLIEFGPMSAVGEREEEVLNWNYRGGGRVEWGWM